MNVAFVDLKQNYLSIKNEIRQELDEVLESTQYIMGPKVAAFEAAFGTMHGSAYCFGTSSGTDANHLALWALNISPGDEVIVPVNTFIATAWGVTLCGAKPVFVDCNADSYTIDPQLIESSITPRTKAIVAVHLYGQPADMDPIREIAIRHNLFLIEDAAQAHLATYKGNRVGSLGDLASFSFYPGKNLGAYGEGGAVTTNNPEYARAVKLRRDHGSENKYHHEVLGHNYRMESIQGAILGVKLKYLEFWTAQRRAIAGKYRIMLEDVADIVLPREMDYAGHVYHLFVIQCKDRQALQSALAEANIATGLHYPVPLHLQTCFTNLGYRNGNFPIAEQLASQCLSLPLFPEMTDEQVEYVSLRIRAHFKTNQRKKKVHEMSLL